MRGVVYVHAQILRAGTEHNVSHVLDHFVYNVVKIILNVHIVLVDMVLLHQVAALDVFLDVIIVGLIKIIVIDVQLDMESNR